MLSSQSVLLEDAENDENADANVDGVVPSKEVAEDDEDEEGTAIRDVLHSTFSYSLTCLLHRDISVGNVVLDEDSCGILNDDWDLAANGPIYRTAMFLSILSLGSRRRNKNHRHSVLDDVESCFWVLLYMSVHHFAHNLCDIHLDVFDGCTLKRGWNGVEHWVGGRAKGNFLAKGEFMVLRFECERLNDVVRGFGLHLEFFHVLHRLHGGLPSCTPKYEQAKKALIEGTKVFAVFDKALGAHGWPDADVLPEQFPTVTEVWVDERNGGKLLAKRTVLAGTGWTTDEDEDEDEDDEQIQYAVKRPRRMNIHEAKWKYYQNRSRAKRGRLEEQKAEEKGVKRPRITIATDPWAFER
ncbi:hypothetical protein BDW22DRAFT_1430135 [Trametopsis cervina]|nr:hypothetical protein BDW22DRAFT_1430135 [Trametopsis cervina]